MITADQAADLLQSDLYAKVTTMKRDGIDKMDAYQRIGRALGKSGVWVRRVVGRDRRASVDLRDTLNFAVWAHGLNPASAYQRLCDRIGAAADAIEADNEALRREIDAALGGDRPALARVAQAGAPEEAAARGPGHAPAQALVAPIPRPRRVRSSASGDLNDLPLWRAMTEE